MTISFRSIPTFGSSTIRRFATNASEMKKLAARDFEDLLQVRLRMCDKKKENTNFRPDFSAVYQYLKGCCQSHITQPSWHSCTEQPNGMHLQSFGYIPRVLCSTLTDLQRCSGGQCENLETSLILLLRLSSFQRRQEHDKGAKTLVKGRKKQVQVLLRGENPEAWTSSPTNGTRLEIMSVPFVSSVEPMASQLNW